MKMLSKGKMEPICFVAAFWSLIQTIIMKYLLAVLLWISAYTASAQNHKVYQSESKREFTLIYGHNVYADFLFYLFYRNVGNYPTLLKAVPLTAVSNYHGAAITLTERANVIQIKNYRALYPLLEPYKQADHGVEEKPLKHLSFGEPLPNFDTLKIIIKQGEKFFPLFEKFWKDSIEQAELNTISVWKEQAKALKVVEKLFALLRVKPKFDSLFVGAIALHTAGSGLVDQPSIHTQLFKKPNLPWFMGHELTHLLIGQYTGEDWSNQKDFADIMKYLKDNEISYYEVEESLCLFIQVKLSQTCGLLAENYKISAYLPDHLYRKRIVRILEDHWTSYENNTTKFPNIVKYLKWCVEQALHSNIRKD